jgi:hydrogenase nickel incorporation protein HypB
MSEKIEIVENIMGANEKLAADNRAKLDKSQTFGINIMASPGAGKTSLIEQTVPALREKFAVGAVDGDVATTIDADRAAAAGATAVQINTGGSCHLDAVMLQHALNQLDLNSLDLLLVENVGNLICPAGFALGTHKNIVVASIPEGDDKPHKYPNIYRGIDVLIINKIDLLPYIPFRMEFFTKGVEMLNPGLITFSISCQTGEGIPEWLAWLENEIKAFKEQSPSA